MSSGHSPGHSPSSTLNIHNNLSNEDNEQVQIEKILLNAQENILSAGEYDYGVENITDVDLNTHYHEESIRKHDGKARKNSKESKINKFQILLKECDESVTSNLINATLFKEEEMDELNKIMAELMDVYQEMKVVNFDEELVAFMKF
uniref:Uncharacterized protein n=1 Tax=Rhabditophanes sp. KR3021 TaxID=114890 RepID=A0AC35TMU4_9BILA